MIRFVASSRIELEYQVPETCVLSIVLRGPEWAKLQEKILEPDQLSSATSALRDVSFFSIQSEKITQANAAQNPASTSVA